MIGTEQHAGAVVLEGIVHRRAIGIDEACKIAIGHRHRRQFDMANAFARKARNRRSACHHRHVEAIGDQCMGHAAGAGDMADAEQMLDIEKHAGSVRGLGCSGSGHGVFSHSCSKRFLRSVMLVR